MDASERLERHRVQDLREGILQTREAIAQNIDRLQDAVRAEASALANPFHIRERIERHPLLACVVAVGLGVLAANKGARAIPARLVVGVGRGVAVLTRDLLVSRGLEALRGEIGTSGH